MVMFQQMRRSFGMSEVWLYARKSTASENASKSIEDQVEVMLETCQELSIPATQFNVHAEEIGHGGDEWWQGGGLSGLRNDKTKANRFRPVLTAMMEAIIDGSCKAVVCYSQDRLWRDTGICDKMIDMFLEYGVALYDKYGPVDIETSDGRNKVRSMAVAAQTYRERSAEDSKRGVDKNRGKGKLVVSAHCLGFRGAGKHSRSVITVREELPIVERIFRMYVHGEGTNGPMSTTHIAERLMSEGFCWMPDCTDKRRKRNASTEAYIYEWQIIDTLRNCRYQGRQPHGKKEWPCDAFLVDGETAIPTKLYEDAQEKLRNAKKVGNAASPKHALVGLLRCGLCGQGLHCVPVGKVRENGERMIYWRPDHATVWSWCKDKLPYIRKVILDQYVDDVFAPLLLADLRERRASITESDLENSLASLRRRLCDMEAEQEREIEELMDAKADAKVIAIKGRKNQEATLALCQQVAETERMARDLRDLDVRLGDLAALTPEARRDAIQRTIRWVALLPSTKPKEKHPTWYYERRSADGGRLVFLTAYGTYHCATLRYGDIGDTRPGYSLHPSTPEETIGTVGDFPDPAKFLAGLKRAYDGRKYKYDPFEVAPGLNANQVAAFDVTEEENVARAENAGD